MSSKLFSGHISDILFFFTGNPSGGGKIGSITSLLLYRNQAYLKVFSSIVGIIFESNGQQRSNAGLVFTSMRYVLKQSSTIKSYPKISN
jgi:hypothetical protein